MLAPEQEKVAKIFGRFDEDKDGVLRRVSLVYLGLHTVRTVSMSLLSFGCKNLVPQDGHPAVEVARCLIFEEVKNKLVHKI